jgi:hypothetical protein
VVGEQVTHGECEKQQKFHEVAGCERIGIQICDSGRAESLCKPLSTQLIEEAELCGALAVEKAGNHPEGGR